MDNPVSAAEAAKVASDYLRGTLSGELTNHERLFSKPAIGVLKFHGVYQQDDRDLRKSGAKQFSCMVRVGVPGGRLTAKQYLSLDKLGDIGDGSLRVTTRQDFQYHYVPKERLRELIRGINDCYLSTLAACGDVVRNVVSCPTPIEDRQRQDLWPYIELISRELKPKTTAYFEIWMDGGRIASAEEESSPVEPLYGVTYLPRKFKIAFAYPGDNTTDIYTNDIGIVPQYDNGTLTAFTILAGGGMGQSAGVKASHPRLADPICSIGPDAQELLSVVKAIVTIHRDFGNRTNRKLARLKYVLDAWGVEKFKDELQKRVGHPLAEPELLHWHRANDYLGWHRQGVAANGKPIWFVGVRIISGRIRDFDARRRIRDGLRSVIEEWGMPVRLTAQQNVYLTDISDADRPKITERLKEFGIAEPEALPPVLRHAIACPALPTCGQALTESERIMPDVVAEIQNELNAVGLDEQVVHLRTSGCPNGCSRPYTAEIGIVGVSIDMYSIYLGASPLGTRLGTILAQNVRRSEIPNRIRPAIERYRRERRHDESFGDFCHRVGVENLREQPVLVGA